MKKGFGLSFAIDHDLLSEGLYVSGVNEDLTTYDLRMKKPNRGDYLENASLHTIEHMLSFYLRNSDVSKDVIYVGPMGCRTGFYIVLRNNISVAEAVKLIREGLEYITDFEGDVPGAKRKECGNYAEHDLAGAKKEAEKMLVVLKDWNEARTDYNYKEN